MRQAGWVQGASEQGMTSYPLTNQPTRKMEVSNHQTASHVCLWARDAYPHPFPTSAGAKTYGR